MPRTDETISADARMFAEDYSLVVCHLYEAFDREEMRRLINGQTDSTQFTADVEAAFALFQAQRERLYKEDAA
jgi:hypothetical protein